jgi:plasmid stabilization system protein ParE
LNVRFLPAAQAELDDTVDWYEAESVGLGKVFLTEVLSSLDRIRAFPQAWHMMSKYVRRCQTRRFPYGVIYAVEYDQIIVLAIANLHRKPDYWRDRIE